MTFVNFFKESLIRKYDKDLSHFIMVLYTGDNFN